MTICIADVGSTHGGTLEGCLEAIDIAKDAGVDILKYQLFKGNDNGNIELPREHWATIVECARSKDLDIFASAFDEEAIQLLYDTGIKKVKLAYSQNFNLKLIKKAKELGMEIWASGDYNNYPNYANIKMFCVPQYPVKNYGVFDCVGWDDWDGISCHGIFSIDDINNKIYSNRCKYLEKHFHLNRKVDVPDYWFALSPKELKELVCQLKKRQ